MKLPSVAAVFNVMEKDPTKAFVVSEEGNGRVLTPVRDESTKGILDMKNHDKSKGGKKKGNGGGNYGRARPPQRSGNGNSRTFPSTNYNGGGAYQSRVSNTFSTPKPAPPKQPSFPSSKPTYGEDWGANVKPKKYYAAPSTAYITGGNENKIFDPTAGKRKPPTTPVNQQPPPPANRNPVGSTNGNLDSRTTPTSNSFGIVFNSHRQTDSNPTPQSRPPTQNHSPAKPAYNPAATNQSPGPTKPSNNFSKPNINTQSHSSDSIKSMEIKMDRMNINLETPAQIIFKKASDEEKFKLIFKHTRQYPNVGMIPLLEHFQDGT